VARPAPRLARTSTLVTTVVTALLALVCAAALAPVEARAGRAQWSVFEDHAALIRSSHVTRERLLKEIEALGADTLRIELKWNEVAPSPRARRRPAFDAADPAVYPGFGPYDELVREAVGLRMRVLVTITGDAPRWATAGGRARSFRTANYEPNAAEYGRFAGAVAKRYSGKFAGLPAVRYFSIWNEPNHVQFLKPQRNAPRLYRDIVAAGLPAIRRNATRGANIFVGETAPVGRPGKVIGPKAFLRRWLCLDRRFRPTRNGAGCHHFKKVQADGFAHHPYGPVERVARKKDIINLLAIRRLGKYLDLAAHARRLPFHLPIYSTEFGLQSNPPDRLVSTTPARQARLIGQKEEYSYRYSRLKSYSQYLLYDDPVRPGPLAVRWSGFQTGLRFPSGREKPAYRAYRLAIVVHLRRRGVYIWGHVRPGEGARYVRLQRRGRRGYVNSGGRIATDSRGYFSLRRARLGSYRVRAYEDPRGRRRLGTSLTVSPIP
jgi:hypothetical protein